MKLLLSLMIGLCVIAASARAEQRLVGPDGMPTSLRDAVAAAADGDVIEMLPGDYQSPTLRIEGKRLTLRGMGGRPVLRGDPKQRNGKGLIVVRNADVTVDNLEFRGSRSDNADGAGIHLESGRLKVLRSHFLDNESGITTANTPDAELVIEASVFGMAPQDRGGLHHLLSVGRIGRLTVTGSRFHQGFEGHLIKSRARETRLQYNVIYDGTRGGASYEVDLPNGGLAWLIGNVIGQATTTQNPVVVAYGNEGARWERNALYLSHNTFVNHQTLPAWFLRVWRDELPADTEVWAVNNLLVGGGLFSWGASGHFDGNWPVLLGSLRDTATLDFTPLREAWAVGRGVDASNVGGQDLRPKFEFSLPVGTRPLTPPAAWTPGAFQP